MIFEILNSNIGIRNKFKYLKFKILNHFEFNKF